MYKHLYSRFLNAHPEDLHFASHSHHYWPDVTREAQIQYWDDSCRWVDKKWNYFFSEKVPRAQQGIAKILGLDYPQQIVFAPNTHEFVFRLLSSLDWSKKNRILTTDSEFYSFDRQINRLSEMDSFEVKKIPTQPFDSFEARFEQEMRASSWDMVFLSHVFFNSGVSCDIHQLAQSCSEKTLFVVDGYHGFMAIPTNLSLIQTKIFYLAGSYKYAQGGEGACFLYVPPATHHRPFYTGWFAELSHLSNIDNQVGYPSDALQYAGSTLDMSPIYRLNSVFDLMEKNSITVEQIHRHVSSLQQVFINALEPAQSISKKNFLSKKDLAKNQHGHFLTFALPSAEYTQEFGQKLENKGLRTDSRGARLRFGFGLYHDEKDVKKAVGILNQS